MKKVNWFEFEDDNQRECKSKVKISSISCPKCKSREVLLHKTIQCFYNIEDIENILLFNESSLIEVNNTIPKQTHLVYQVD